MGALAVADQAEAMAAPIAAAEFHDLIAAFGPFEHRPALAVAVSGGADSLCLALLAHDWARARGGTVTALIVDHGLRTESAAEAETVAGWLRAHGIAAVVLRWHGVKPVTGVQEAARAARYRLLRAWCAAAGVLHLLVGHQHEDQVETVLLRAERGSGADGLAGMAAIVELAECRILRPLLAMPALRLRATLRARGQAWIEDPSNRNPVFARTRLRAAADAAPRPDIAAAGRARRTAEAAVAALLARSVAIFPDGSAMVDAAAWASAPADIARRALVRVLLTVGGGAYPPRGDRLDPLLDALRRGGLRGGRTLAGCRLVSRGLRLLVAREAGRIAPTATLPAGPFIWDDRFLLTLSAGTLAGLRLAPLGAAGWRAVLAAAPEIRARAPLYPVSTALPALFDLEGVRDVPHLMYGRRGADPDSVRLVSAMFRPRHALAGPGFAQS